MADLMVEKSPFRLVSIDLDERSVVRRTREIEQEREIAIYDLLEENSFAPIGSPGGPYDLVLSAAENRLGFGITVDGAAPGQGSDPRSLSARRERALQGTPMTGKNPGPPGLNEGSPVA